MQDRARSSPDGLSPYARRAMSFSRPEGPLVWAPGLNGGALLSLRGGDFIFDSDQDLAIGYDSHDAETIRLYLEQSFSFHVATPEAAVALSPATG